MPALIPIKDVFYSYKEQTHNLNAMILPLFSFEFCCLSKIENEIEFQLLTIFLFLVRTTGKRMTEKGKLSTTENQLHFQF